MLALASDSDSDSDQIHRQTVDQFYFCAPTQEGSCLASSTKTEGGMHLSTVWEGFQV